MNSATQPDALIFSSVGNHLIQILYHRIVFICRKMFLTRETPPPFLSMGEAFCLLLQAFWRLAKTLYGTLRLLLLGAVRIAALAHVTFLLAVYVVRFLFHVHSSSLLIRK